MTDRIVEKQRAMMRREGLDAIVISSPENIAYTADVVVPSQAIVRHRLVLCLVSLAGPITLIVVSVEENFVRQTSTAGCVVSYNEFTEGPIQVLADRMRHSGLEHGRIGIEQTAMSMQAYESLRAGLPHATFVPVDEALQTLRMIKTPEELSKLRHIGKAAERAARMAFERAQIGMTEVELGQLITDAYLTEHGDRLTMLVVASGDRSGLANAAPTNRRLQEGNLIRVDVIGTGSLYYSDVARTAVVGQPTDEQSRVWEHMVDARKTALDSIRPGARTRPIYQRYAEQMAQWNLPPINFLGHGLGLTLHEEPYIGPYTDIELEPGMVLCIEPLAWYSDWGVQLEDEIVVTEDGYELITDQYDETTLLSIPM